MFLCNISRMQPRSQGPLTPLSKVSWLASLVTCLASLVTCLMGGPSCSVVSESASAALLNISTLSGACAERVGFSLLPHITTEDSAAT